MKPCSLRYTTLEVWKDDYNTVRAHSKLGGKTPAEIAAKSVRGTPAIQLATPSNIIMENKDSTFKCQQPGNHVSFNEFEA